MADEAQPRLLYLGVGVDKYEFFSELGKSRQAVTTIGELLRDERNFEPILQLDVTDGEAETGVMEALPLGSLAGGKLVVFWCSHGQASDEGQLRLITANARPDAAATRTADWLVSVAAHTGASQVLLLLDTCYSGTGLINAAQVVSRLSANLRGDALPGWIGILASAQGYEKAREGVFFAQLDRLLRQGPSDAVLRLRFNAFNQGVRGSDVMEALVEEWTATAQTPSPMTLGHAGVLLPNPLYDPDAPEQVVEHLLLAAQGRGPDEQGVYFTGRDEQLATIIDWMGRDEPGTLVVTGPAGSGKSAIAGRIVSLSNPAERANLLALGPIELDPGERSVQAHVHARRLTLDRVAGLIDDQLGRAGVLAPRAGDGWRNHHELLGELRRLDEVPTIVIDGLDEAEGEAWSIADDLIRGLSQHTKVLVATREMERGDERLVESIATEPSIDLGDPRWAAQTRANVVEYVGRRLADLDVVPHVMDPARVGQQLVALASDSDEGAFLLARVVTAQLRDDPVDTGTSGWEQALSTTVEAALDRDLARVEGDSPSGVDGPTAARELLTALAWSYGAGVPDDAWALFATALSNVGATYTRDEV
jgi:hypothetical protein